jgi:hypothetical protein
MVDRSKWDPEMAAFVAAGGKRRRPTPQFGLKFRWNRTEE